MGTLGGLAVQRNLSNVAVHPDIVFCFLFQTQRVR
jgi:hypothetical protein